MYVEFYLLFRNFMLLGINEFLKINFLYWILFVILILYYIIFALFIRDIFWRIIFIFFKFFIYLNDNFEFIKFFKQNFYQFIFSYFRFLNFRIYFDLWNFFQINKVNTWLWSRRFNLMQNMIRKEFCDIGYIFLFY